MSAPILDALLRSANEVKQLYLMGKQENSASAEAERSHDLRRSRFNQVFLANALKDGLPWLCAAL
jgi:hypothetical protein